MKGYGTVKSSITSQKSGPDKLAAHCSDIDIYPCAQQMKTAEEVTHR